jgi:hypothetical protein
MQYQTITMYMRIQNIAPPIKSLWLLASQKMILKTPVQLQYLRMLIMLRLLFAKPFHISNFNIFLDWGTSTKRGQANLFSINCHLSFQICPLLLDLKKSY